MRPSGIKIEGCLPCIILKLTRLGRNALGQQWVEKGICRTRSDGLLQAGSANEIVGVASTLTDGQEDIFGAVGLHRESAGRNGPARGILQDHAVAVDGVENGRPWAFLSGN